MRSTVLNPDSTFLNAFASLAALPARAALGEPTAPDGPGAPGSPGAPTAPTAPSRQTSSTAVIEREEELDSTEPGDSERFAHYVRKDKIAASAVSGAPVVALCGKVWTPGRDPNKYPVCPQCKEIYEEMMGGPGGGKGGPGGGKGGGRGWPFGRGGNRGSGE